MRFLIDAMLPREFVTILRNQGFEARHASRLKSSSVEDHAIWETACSNKEIVISKDRDFVQLANSDSRTRFVWYRIPNETYNELIVTFTKNISRILIRLQSEDTIVEIN